MKFFVLVIRDGKGKIIFVKFTIKFKKCGLRLQRSGPKLFKSFEISLYPAFFKKLCFGIKILSQGIIVAPVF
jgi:hypothetical protein